MYSFTKKDIRLNPSLSRYDPVRLGKNGSRHYSVDSSPGCSTSTGQLIVTRRHHDVTWRHVTSLHVTSCDFMWIHMTSSLAAIHFIEIGNINSSIYPKLQLFSFSNPYTTIGSLSDGDLRSPSPRKRVTQQLRSAQRAPTPDLESRFRYSRAQQRQPEFESSEDEVEVSRGFYNWLFLGVWGIAGYIDFSRLLPRQESKTNAFGSFAI